MVITAVNGYKAFNPSRNGILGGNGQINLKSGSEVNLKFTFVEGGTNTEHVMPRFYMTFSDLDERHGGTERERIKVSGFDKFYTNDDLALVNDSAGIPSFTSSDYGNYDDNDFSPDSPDPVQLSHAVTYLFTNRASFNAVYTVESEKTMNKGRNVLFSGISQLVFCQDKSTYLDIKNSTVTVNNLGGHGPGSGVHEIRYSGVGSNSEGQSFDLVATVNEDYGYHVWNSSQNGKFGDFGHINLFSGPTNIDSRAIVTFTIMNSGTNTPAVQNQFAFVVFDFDTGLHEQQVEYIEMRPNNLGFGGGAGYTSYILTQTSEIAVSQLSNGKKKFTATKHGTVADNPTHSQNLARETADKSVVFTFRRVASFTMVLGITPTGQNTGRNFMFSGQDMYLMCD
jgi:hypothetical protein